MGIGLHRSCTLRASHPGSHLRIPATIIQYANRIKPQIKLPLFYNHILTLSHFPPDNHAKTRFPHNIENLE